MHNYIYLCIIMCIMLHINIYIPMYYMYVYASFSLLQGTTFRASCTEFPISTSHHCCCATATCGSAPRWEPSWSTAHPTSRPSQSRPANHTWLYTATPSPHTQSGHCPVVDLISSSLKSRSSFRRTGRLVRLLKTVRFLCPPPLIAISSVSMVVVEPAAL